MTNGAQPKGAGAEMPDSVPSVGITKTPSMAGSKTRIIIVVIVVVAVVIGSIGAYFLFSGGSKLDGTWKAIHMKIVMNNVTQEDINLPVAEQVTFEIKENNISNLALVMYSGNGELVKTGTNQWNVTGFSSSNYGYTVKSIVITLNGDTLTLKVSEKGNFGYSQNDLEDVTFTYVRVTS